MFCSMRRPASTTTVDDAVSGWDDADLNSPTSSMVEASRNYYYD